MKKILLIGYGKMGSAIVQGWIKNKLNFQIYVIEKEDLDFNTIKRKDICFLNDFESFIKLNLVPDFVFIAIKPQQLLKTKGSLKLIYNSKSIFISIVAGVSTNWFEDHLSKEIKIVRAMPNTPAAVLKGVTGVFHSKNLIKSDINNINKILKCIGKVIFLKKQNLIDVVTGISGSGPAYYFLLTEILYRVGEELGLSKEDSLEFSKATFIGSATLFDKSNLSISRLRDNVTSPGGTTEAALKILMQKNNGLEKLVEKTVKAAILRAKELNKK